MGATVQKIWYLYGCLLKNVVVSPLLLGTYLYLFFFVRFTTFFLHTCQFFRPFSPSNSYSFPVVLFYAANIHQYFCRERHIFSMAQLGTLRDIVHMVLSKVHITCIVTVLNIIYADVIWIWAVYLVERCYCTCNAHKTIFFFFAFVLAQSDSGCLYRCKHFWWLSFLLMLERVC